MFVSKEHVCRMEDRLKPVHQDAVSKREAEQRADSNRRDCEQNQRQRHGPWRLVHVNALTDATLPPEGEPHQTEHVEGGSSRNHHSNEPDPRVTELKCLTKDFVFRPESGERRKACNCNRADQHRGVGDRDLSGEPAHLRHLLFTFNGVNHGTGSKEEEPLKEAVRDEVEDRRNPCANAECGEHVAELRKC